MSAAQRCSSVTRPRPCPAGRTAQGATSNSLHKSHYLAYGAAGARWWSRRHLHAGKCGQHVSTCWTWRHQWRGQAMKHTSNERRPAPEAASYERCTAAAGAPVPPSHMIGSDKCVGCALLQARCCTTWPMTRGSVLCPAAYRYGQVAPKPQQLDDAQNTTCPGCHHRAAVPMMCAAEEHPAGVPAPSPPPSVPPLAKEPGVAFLQPWPATAGKAEQY